ncbi:MULTISPECIES: type VI secretion system protein TssA [unclassified Janthinobacterium]|uniref:type VI secretion system protein TssA n=1 Tax=unclassified Janthinobacterium TaxID=2610881 RepID=UPI00034C915D|nr:MULTISPECIES: type VI secretion system protein TssA [unclassified Janthinobacterium]MEC5164094.1 type VI secretion system protein ImpA [Janthinobacterium sp. CG_S6]
MFSANQLLSPISDAQPSGADLSFSADLDAIGLARRFDDPSLDQGEWVTELKEADWDFVARRCAALLENTSKDLRLAVWLTEAGATQWHLRGLGEGLRLLAGLCERFWDLGLYPESDGDDHDQRIGNLSWILSRVPALVRAMPLTEGRDSGYSSIDFEVARKVANLSESARPAGSLKLADLETARRNSSPQFNAALASDARDCIDALKALEQVADARLGNDSPGFSAARDALQDMLRTLPAASAGAGVEGAGTAPAHPAGTAHAPDQPGQTAQPAAPAGAPGALNTRAQALQQLRLVAQFFRRTEPHSPVSYFADKAADAGEQDLHTWLRSVVKDAGSLAHIEELLGVQPAGSE